MRTFFRPTRSSHFGFQQFVYIYLYLLSKFRLNFCFFIEKLSHQISWHTIVEEIHLLPYM